METIRTKIESDKELMKRINAITYYSVDLFISDVQTYIDAIREGRMLCVIPKVSPSGMSRQIKFHSWEPTERRGYYRQYWSLFTALGYSKARGNDNAFSINGCGMDMIFHTNYTNMHRFARWGFITKEECDHLAQQTPTVL
jgi:hypothetical protein